MRLGKRLYSLLMFLVVAVLGGVLTAGLVVPAASLLSSGGITVAQGMESLPAELETPPQAERSRLVDSDGNTLAYFYNENRVYLTIDKISPIMRVAQVAIEDHRFYEHGAIDVTGTLRALVSTTRGNTQGASSITQQYVRLVQIEQADLSGDKAAKAVATENTMARKIREMRFAVAVEEKFTKDQILERYLNISYYGAGAYGVEAAARRYFGIGAGKLDLAQSAMLAGMVRNPIATNPFTYPEVAIERRNNVLDRMLELKLITPEETTVAKETPFDPDAGREYLKGCANSEFPFVCDYAERVLLKEATSLGDTPAARKERLYRGGLTITTTLETKTQRNAEKTLRGYLDARDPAVAAIVLIEPGTGKILTMAQSRQAMGTNIKKGQTYYNYAVTNDMGGSDGFQGGSTFKAFVAAAALEEGMGAYTNYTVKGTMDFTGKTFKSCDGNFPAQKWKVSGGGGSVNLFSGAARSVNGYFAQLEQPILCESTQMADRLGLKLSKPTETFQSITDYDNIPSFTLGAAEIAPLSLVEAYATFGARGIHCDPVIIEAITTKDKKDLAVPSANCKRVLSEEVADAMNKVFQGPYRSGTARAAQVSGAQMAGKTGTVDGNKAIWTMGYTSTLAGGAVISWDSNPAYAKFWKPRAKSNLHIKGAYMKYSKRYIRGISGTEAGGYLLKPAFAYALKSRPNGKFTEPPASILRGEQVAVPSCSGMGAASCRSRLHRAGFSTQVANVDSDAPKGTFVGISPSGSAPKFSNIVIRISKGPKKEEKPEKEDPTTPAVPGQPEQPR